MGLPAVPPVFARAPRPLTQTGAFALSLVRKSRIPGRPRATVRALPEESQRRAFTPLAHRRIPRYTHTFRPSFELRQRITWYPGHMAKTLRLISESRLKQAHVVVEVRDARIPFSSINPHLEQVLQTSKKPRIIILNKADLAGISFPSTRATRIATEVREKSPGHVESVMFCRGNDTLSYQSGIKRLITYIAKHFPQRFKTTPRIVLVVGPPNVGKSSIINALRRVSGRGRKGRAKTGSVPGITRDMCGFVVNDEPPVYVIDSPGILPPRFQPGDSETPLKLALCGNINDSAVGSRILSDFLLYSLNKNRQFEYMKLAPFLAPSEDIDFVLSMVANRHTRSRTDQEGLVNEHNASGFLVKLFREGKLGRFLLDYVGCIPDHPSKIRLEAPKDLHDKFLQHRAMFETPQIATSSQQPQEENLIK